MSWEACAAAAGAGVAAATPAMAPPRPPDMVAFAGGVDAAVAVVGPAASVVWEVALVEWRPLAPLLPVPMPSTCSDEEAPDEGARFVAFFAALPIFLDLSLSF